MSATQLDLLRHSPAELARAYRIAADTALANPWLSALERKRRAEYYRGEAERIEREANRGR